MIPTYDFKAKPETIWLVVLLALGGLVKAIESLTPDQSADWHLWVPVLIVAIGRPVLGALASLCFGPPDDTTE